MFQLNHRYQLRLPSHLTYIRGLQRRSNGCCQMDQQPSTSQHAAKAQFSAAKQGTAKAI